MHPGICPCCNARGRSQWRKRIGGIVRARDLRKLQDAPRHLHDLMLLRLAVADDRLLDLQGGVLKDRKTQVGGDESRLRTGR